MGSLLTKHQLLYFVTGHKATYTPVMQIELDREDLQYGPARHQQRSVTSLAFNHSATRLAVGLDERVIIFDKKTGERIDEIVLYSAGPENIAGRYWANGMSYLPTGEFVVVIRDNLGPTLTDHLALYSTTPSSEMWRVTPKATSDKSGTEITCVLSSPDATKLFVATTGVSSQDTSQHKYRLAIVDAQSGVEQCELDLSAVSSPTHWWGRLLPGAGFYSKNNHLLLVAPDVIALFHSTTGKVIAKSVPQINNSIQTLHGFSSLVYVDISEFTEISENKMQGWAHTTLGNPQSMTIQIDEQSGLITYELQPSQVGNTRVLIHNSAKTGKSLWVATRTFEGPSPSHQLGRLTQPIAQTIPIKMAPSLKAILRTELLSAICVSQDGHYIARSTSEAIIISHIVKHKRGKRIHEA